MLEIIRAASPYPTIREDGELFDGLLLPQSKKCVLCIDRSCRRNMDGGQVNGYPLHVVCEYGLSVIAIPTSVGILLVNGVYIPEHNPAMPKNTRKANRQRKIATATIDMYWRSIKKTEDTILEAIEQRTTYAVSGIHDIRTAVSLVYRNAEVIVANFRGDSMEEKIEQASPDMKCLLKSVQLLKSRLEMTSIANNPISASFGRKRQTPIYKMFHRMVRLFEEEANQKLVSIRMRGSSFSTALLYDSFESVPLVLLDNAVKYAFPNTEITVTVEDRSSAISVSVSSIGQIVPPEEAPLIFEKSYRAEGAKRFTSSGSGLGLFIAQTVALANGFSIQYSSEPSGEDDGGGENSFSFAIYGKRSK